jgi:chemotaxis protein CheC
MNQLYSKWQPEILRDISEHALQEAACLIRVITQREISIRLSQQGLTDFSDATNVLVDASQQQLLVRQPLTGGVRGYAALLIAKSCAQDLLRDLLAERPPLNEMTELEEEAISEIANILLNHCLDNFIELNKEPCGSELPELLFGSMPALLDELRVNADDQVVFYLQAEMAGVSKSCPVQLLFASGFFI